MNIAKSLSKLIEEFLIYCEVEKNKSPRTIIAYEHYLRRFDVFCAGQGINTPSQIDLEIIRNFRLYLNRFKDDKGNHLKLTTQTYHVIAVRAFLKYLSKRDIPSLAPEKIELPKTPSREIHPVNPDQISKMQTATSENENMLITLRDFALLVTLFASGVRVSEISNLTWEHINLETGEFTVRGKGDKLRLTFLSEEAIEAIKRYKKARHDNSPFVFINHSRRNSNAVDITGKSQGLTSRSIQRLVKKYSLLAGLTSHVTPHSLRHSFATDLLQNGADIRSVQTLLGHASITTTQIYTHVTNRQLKEVHKKFHKKNSDL